MRLSGLPPKIIATMPLLCGKCNAMLHHDWNGFHEHPDGDCEDARVQFTLRFDEQGFLKLEEVGRA